MTSTEHTPAQLVRMLKDSDGEVRSKALTEILSDSKGTAAMLIRVRDTGIELTAGSPVDVLHLMTGLLYAAQVVGARLGLTLQWVGDPRAEQQKLIVPSSADLKVLR